MEAQGSDKKELLRLVPLLERKFQSSERKCVVHLLQREIAYDEKLSQEMEIVSNLRPIVFWLKVRTRGPQPSICVRTFSLFTNWERGSASASLLLLRQYVRGTGLAGLGLGSTELVQEGRQASAERRIPCLQFSDQTSSRHSQRPA